jgi:hypothetical protein
MPQIDFRQIFSAKALGPRSESAPPRSKLSESDPHEAGFLGRIQLSRAQWTNIGFVACACIGALFSAAYLYKGGEILRVVRAWPREVTFHPLTGSDLVATSGEPAAGLTGNPSTKQSPNWDRTGDPFSRSRTQLSLNPDFPIAANRMTNGTSSSNSDSSVQPSLLRNLGVPAPGGDTLSKMLSEGSDLGRGTASQSNSAMAAAKTSASQIGHRASTRARSASTSARSKVQTGTHRAGRFAGQHSTSDAKQRVAGSAKANVQTAKTVSARGTNSTANRVSAPTSAGQQLGSLHGGAGLGHGSQNVFRGPGR